MTGGALTDTPHTHFVERRVAAAASAGSIKLPSPAPATVPPTQGTGGTSQRSRLSQQVHTATTGRGGRRATASVGPDADEDAEGEEDIEDETMEDNGDADDQALYCLCQKMSYGEMIACDNPDCPFQWVSTVCLVIRIWLTYLCAIQFHLPCVNLKPPLPEKWYCAHCLQKFGVSVGPTQERRKGRKKQ